MLLLISITLSCSAITNVISEKPLAVKQIRTKNGIVYNIVETEEHLDYPGSNPENLAKISENWNKYYKCLIHKFEHEKERKPVIIQIMEGQYTSLKCSYCQRPFEGNANLEWRYKPLSSDIDDPDEPQVLDLAPQIRVSKRMTLKIYNAIVGYSGLYVCYRGRHPISVYILEVMRDQGMAPLKEEPVQNDTVEVPDRTNLVIYYYWSKWTECSTCDVIGKKFKYGTCMAKLQEPVPHKPLSYVASEHYLHVKREITKFKRRSTKKRGESFDTQHFDIKEMETAKQVIDKFQTGIPCTSNILPNAYKALILGLNKPATAVIVDYCQVACPDSLVFQVLDVQGRIIDSANNTAGIYSSYQSIPKTPPDVERKTLTADFGKDIVLQCPGNLNTDTPVTWMIDKKLLIPELISNESNGRIFIDLLNRLHINRLRLKDSNVYSCWQRDRLAGTVALNVDKKLTFSPNHHIILLAMLLIAMTFLYILIRIWKREIKLRKN